MKMVRSKMVTVIVLIAPSLSNAATTHCFVGTTRVALMKNGAVNVKGVVKAHRAVRKYLVDLESWYTPIALTKKR